MTLDAGLRAGGYKFLSATGAGAAPLEKQNCFERGV
jgi:hypothetical protein